MSGAAKRERASEHRRPTIAPIVSLCAALSLMLASGPFQRQTAAAGLIEKLAEPLTPIFDFQIEKGQLVLNRAAWERTAAEARKQSIDAMNASLERNQKKMTLEAFLKLKQDGRNTGLVQQALMQLRQQDQAKAYAKRMDTLPDLYFLCDKVWQKASQFNMNGSSPQGNMMRQGDGYFSQSFQGSVSFQASGTATAERIQIRQTSSPNALYFTNDDIDGFRLEVTTTNNDLIVLQQHVDSFSVLTIRNEKIFSDSSATFVAFVQTHRELMTDFIFPGLARVGFRPALPTDSPVVRAAALNLLANNSQERVDVDKVFAELSSTDRKIRENAQTMIAADYEQFRALVEERLQSKVVSVEGRAQLLSIVEAQNKMKPARQTVVAFGLLSDPQYLVSLLDGADPRVSSQIIGQLEKLTGQKLGSDPEKWKAWAKANAPDERK